MLIYRFQDRQLGNGYCQRPLVGEREFPPPRVADWIFYAGKFYSDVEIVPSDQMGSGRNRSRQPFDSRFTEIET